MEFYNVLGGVLTIEPHFETDWMSDVVIALVSSGSCEYFGQALCDRMISEKETMWKETAVAYFKVSSLCHIVLILPQNTYI